MILYLIRHPRTIYGQTLCYGASDVPVDPQVLADAVAQVRPLLPTDIPNENWYASPLSRAANLARALGAAPQLDARMQELNFGDWELVPWNDLPLADLARWGEDFVNSPTPGGESFSQLQERTVAFATDLLATGVEQAVVVTHSGPIRTLTAWALGLPLANAFRLEVGFAGVLKLSLNPDPALNRLLSLSGH
ncbi:MAG: histidine phosphatase family protein [Propionibacteriaceae bacterium]|jgi:alpha-ribazole phosphatase|nr:histidine phosphatase family protein [Propionibacteriaceae bacterium]